MPCYYNTLFEKRKKERKTRVQRTHCINKAKRKALEDFIEKGVKLEGGKTYRAIGLDNQELSGVLSIVKNGKTMRFIRRIV